MPSSSKFCFAVWVGQNNKSEILSEQILFISSGIFLLKLLNPASTWAKGIKSLDAGAPDITYEGNEGPQAPQEEQQMADALLRDEYDKFPKAKIEIFAENRFPGISTQQFYNHYRDLEDMSNKTKIARSYPNLKEIVAEISGNDADVLHCLKEFPR